MGASQPYASASTLGLAGPSGFDADGDILRARISGNFRDQGPVTDFEPYAGAVSFKATADWNFAIDGPMTGQSDFLSTALHEIGHILGFGTAGIFDQIASGGLFDGPNALSVNGGAPIPLAGDKSHVEDAFAGDSVLMDPSQTTGQRKMPTVYDLAMLADIGYEIEGFAKQGVTPPIATEGAETIFGTIVGDLISGLGGADQIQGGGGADTLFGDGGDDVMFGGANADLMSGGADDDYVQGDGGADTLRGGPGDDQLVGGAGVDTFAIEPGDGKNLLTDFNLAAEVVRLSAGFGIAEPADVLALVSKPFSNVSRVTLPDGTTVDIYHASQSGSPLTSAHFEISGDAIPGGVVTGLPTADLFDFGIPDGRLVDGAGGRDTAVYTLTRAQAAVSVNPDGSVSVTGAGATDALSDVEQVRFADGAWLFDLREAADFTYRLYAAALARTPDAGGLRFWDAQKEAGFTNRQLSQAFVDSGEFNSQFGGASPTSEDFIDALYVNVLDRVADAGGRAYWIDAFDGGLARAQMLIAFSESPENLLRTAEDTDIGFWVG
jgi:hypothetical protein